MIEKPDRVSHRERVLELALVHKHPNHVYVDEDRVVADKLTEDPEPATMIVADKLDEEGAMSVVTLLVTRAPVVVTL